MEATWTISELAEHAAEVLAASPQRANGRVRDVPNERLIRWYVTVGLVDPPLSRRGRVARYGERHLLQLVAVKRRQTAGRPLAEIQQELAGATNETLAAVAGLPNNQDNQANQANRRNQANPQPSPAPATAPSAPDRFWARPPGTPAASGTPGTPGTSTAPEVSETPMASGTSEAPGTLGKSDPPQPSARHSSGRDSKGLVHGLRLAPGVLLLLEGTDLEPGPDDVTAILNAAQPLLKSLADRGLSAPGPVRPPEEEQE